MQVAEALAGTDINVARIDGSKFKCESNSFLPNTRHGSSEHLQIVCSFLITFLAMPAHLRKHVLLVCVVVCDIILCMCARTAASLRFGIQGFPTILQ